MIIVHIMDIINFCLDNFYFFNILLNLDLT